MKPFESSLRRSIAIKGQEHALARIGHIGRDLLPENAGTLFSPDSRMTLTAQDPEAARATTLDLSFGGGKNVAERVN